MRSAKVDEELARCDQLHVTLICPDDPTYPTLLSQISDPPPILYVKGSFEPRDLNAIAIVGMQALGWAQTSHNVGIGIATASGATSGVGPVASEY